jgi:TPR repeat protein
MKILLFISFLILLVSCSSAIKQEALIKKECKSGDFLACFEQGKLVYDKNPELGRVYFEKACRLGHEKSCDYHLTSFIKKNKIKESVNYYERECRTSNVYSCTVLGRIHFNLGNKEKGLEFYDNSCKNGEPAACAFLSVERHKKNNIEEELIFMEKACNLGLKAKNEKKTPMYCVLAGSVYARAAKPNLAGKYYRTACKFKEFNKKTLLHKMIACSRAGIYIDQKTNSESKDMFDLGIGYLKSKCLSRNEIYGFKDCYDVATAYSLKKNPGESLKFLEKALQKGYKEWSYILKDHELSFIRQTLPFKKLVNRYYRLFQASNPNQKK